MSRNIVFPAEIECNRFKWSFLDWLYNFKRRIKISFLCKTQQTDVYVVIFT